MNIDPREQAHAYDDWHVEDVPEPEMPVASAPDIAAC